MPRWGSALERPAPRTGVRDSSVRRLYVKYEMSIGGIARLIGCGERAVRAALAREGVVFRGRREAVTIAHKRGAYAKRKRGV